MYPTPPLNGFNPSKVNRSIRPHLVGLLSTNYTAFQSLKGKPIDPARMLFHSWEPGEGFQSLKGKPIDPAQPLHL